MESEAVDMYDPTHSHECDGSDSGIVVLGKPRSLNIVILDTLSMGAVKVVDPVPVPVGMPTRPLNMK